MPLACLSGTITIFIRAATCLLCKTHFLTRRLLTITLFHSAWKFISFGHPLLKGNKKNRYPFYLFLFFLFFFIFLFFYFYAEIIAFYLLIESLFVGRHAATMLVLHLSVAFHDGLHSCNGLHHFPARLLLLGKVKGVRPLRFATNVFRVDLIVQDGESTLNRLIGGLNASLIEPILYRLCIRVVVVGEAAAQRQTLHRRQVVHQLRHGFRILLRHHLGNRLRHHRRQYLRVHGCDAAAQRQTRRLRHGCGICFVGHG